MVKLVSYVASILKSASKSSRKAGKREGNNGREVIVTESFKVQVPFEEIYLGMLYPDLTIDVFLPGTYICVPKAYIPFLSDY